MFKPKTIVAMTASALATLGCASLAPDEAALLSIKPVNAVRHGADANAMYQTGRYFQGQLRYDKAIHAYKEALAANPRHADAYNALGVIYSVQGETLLAEQAFTAAAAAAPAAAYVHNNLGYHYMQYGRLTDALAAFERARELEPGNPRVASNLATVRERLNASGDTAAAPPQPQAQPQAEFTAVAKAETAQAGSTGTSGSPAYRIVSERPVSAAPLVETRVTAEIAVVTQERRAEAPHGSITTPGATAAWAASAPTQVAATASQPIMASAAAATVELHGIAPNVWELRPLAAPAAMPVPQAVKSVELSAPGAQAVPVTPATPATNHRIEIANGNGFTGLAKRVAELLTPRGFDKIRLTNREPYGSAASVIQYLAGTEQAAMRIHSALAVELPLAKVERLNGNAAVRVILGANFPAPVRPVAQARAAQAEMAGLQGYRVEISNGNGSEGLARRVAHSLKPRGLADARLTNQMPFGARESQIEYVAGSEQIARHIAVALALQLPLTEVRTLERKMQVRVMLGKDFSSVPRQESASGPASTQLAANVH